MNARYLKNEDDQDKKLQRASKAVRLGSFFSGGLFH